MPFIKYVTNQCILSTGPLFSNQSNKNMIQAIKKIQDQRCHMSHSAIEYNVNPAQIASFFTVRVRIWGLGCIEIRS